MGDRDRAKHAVADVNDYQFELVKAHGDCVRRSHADTGERCVALAALCQVVTLANALGALSANSRCARAASASRTSLSRAAASPAWGQTEVS
jgi:hypothetical protein